MIQVLARGFAAIAAALRHPRWAASVKDAEYEGGAERIAHWILEGWWPE